jgi:hypothetical protein
MNERIQQFAEVARTSVPAGLDTVEWIAKYNEIFAELIIKECLLFTNPSPHEGTEFGTALAWADKNIREHFGVE